MKRICTFCAALALLPALAFASAYSDVPADAWYADSAALCQETGLMNGTRADTFSPDAVLTLAEVMTVSARLHYRAQGGAGDFPTAPADWGTGTVTTPTGAVLLSFVSGDPDRGLTYSYDTESPRRLHLYLAVSPQELSGLTPAGGPAEASLTLHGQAVLSGTLAPVPDGTARVEFTAAGGADYTDFNREMAAFLPAPATGLWYRNALWYAREHGLLDAQPMATAFEDPATRQDLAEWLVSALPTESLPPINSVAVLPDTTDSDALTLYRAGVLTGVDGAGTFAGERGLTRAELAAVLARVADPERRIHLDLVSTS